ncbi:MAG: hypothetical protein H7Z14_06190 [Anaerolineae bacterium]|nr:hypothetical protein [Phycisphaerae bacterium]
MRWLIHGNVMPAAAEAMRRHEQKPLSAGDAQIAPDASIEEVLRGATKAQIEILTTDSSLVDAIFESGLPFGRTLVYLQLEGGDVEQDDAIDRLFKRYKRLSPGRMYTVTGSRVKVRQLPGKQ